MRCTTFFLGPIFMVVVAVVPSVARADDPPTESAAKAVEITGTVESLSDNILDVKPADTPAVWVTIPADVKVDRSAIKPGVKVSVKASWVDTCYVAKEVTVKK
jgi:hypothetical protein